MADPFLEKWATVLLDYSFGAVDFATEWKKGQKRMVLRYEPPADDLAKIIVEKIFEKGGNVFLEYVPSWFDYTFYSKATDQVLGSRPDAELKKLDHVAARLMILSTPNTKSLATVDPAKRSLRMQALKPIMERTMKVDRQGEFLISWCATLYPTQGFAQDSGMPLDEFRDYVYDAMFLKTADPIKAWTTVSERQRKLKKFLDSAKTVRIVDREGETDLKMSVEGHRWANSDGKRNFPSAEIFNAPRKTSVKGVITFPRIPQSYRGGPEVRNARLVFRKGKLVKWKAEVGQSYFDELFSRHPDAKYLGEIAFGTHPKIQRISKNILYDEKIGGTIHIALGRAYTHHVSLKGDRSQLNVSSVHWDLIRDMRTPTASVLIDDTHEMRWNVKTRRWMVGAPRALAKEENNVTDSTD